MEQQPNRFKKQLAVALAKTSTLFPPHVQNLAMRGPETRTQRQCPLSSGRDTKWPSIRKTLMLIRTS